MDPLSTGLLIVLMVASFYLLIIRPSNRRKAEQAKLHEALKPGARVMLSSGIYGTVVGVGERQATVEVAPGVELRVLKQAVLQAVTPGSQLAEDGAAAAPIEPATGNSVAADEPGAPPAPEVDQPGGSHYPDQGVAGEPGGPIPDGDADFRSEGGEKR